MKINFIVVFFLVAFCHSAFSQANFQGYILTVQGEKIQGELLTKFDQEDYETISFKSLQQGEKNWSPSELKEFRLDNGRYFQTIMSPITSKLEFFQVLSGNEIQILKKNGAYFISGDGKISALKELESFKEVNGRETRVVTKQFQGVLMSVLKPSPEQEKLQRAIRTSSLNDQSLKKVMEQYLSDQGQTNVIVPSSGKAFRTDLRVQAGISSNGLIKSFEDQGLTYRFDKGFAPVFEAGVRFKDFRSAPRIMVDLGLAYMIENDAISLAASKSTFELTGKESYRSSSVVLPIMINYILAKGSKSSFYSGIGLSFWKSSFQSEEVSYEVDNGEGEPFVHSNPFVSRKSMSVSPSLKLGWTMPILQKSNLFVELKGDLNLKNYEFFLLNYYSIFHLGSLSLTGGISF